MWVCRHDSQANITWFHIQFATKMQNMCECYERYWRTDANQINHFVQPYPNFKCSSFSTSYSSSLLFFGSFKIFSVAALRVIFIIRMSNAFYVHCGIHTDNFYNQFTREKKLVQKCSNILSLCWMHYFSIKIFYSNCCWKLFVERFFLGGWGLLAKQNCIIYKQTHCRFNKYGCLFVHTDDMCYTAVRH